MIARAAALSSNDKNENLPETFIRFVNCGNVGMAQYNLVHQFEEQGFPNVAFALGTMQALFIREFLYSDLSTPSNFTIFCFPQARAKFKQSPARLPNLSPSSGKRSH
jgi:hypothetical protein